jgi:hypothetical protein
MQIRLDALGSADFVVAHIAADTFATDAAGGRKNLPMFASTWAVLDDRFVTCDDCR